MPYMRTADAVVESLIRHGIDTLYALPGVHNDHLFDAAHRAQDRFRVLHPRHEQTAAYMALGAALVTGKPQAFAVVPGPGVLNASAALLTAYGMGAPVIALAGQIPSFAIDRGHGHLHEIRDQIGLLRHMTKHAARIRSPHEAPSLVAEAVRIACSGRQRPVALECAIDTWGMTGPVQFPDIAAPTVPPIDAEAVRRAASILGRAERPLIVVGGGVAKQRTGGTAEAIDLLRVDVEPHDRQLFVHTPHALLLIEPRADRQHRIGVLPKRVPLGERHRERMRCGDDTASAAE